MSTRLSANFFRSEPTKAQTAGPRLRLRGTFIDASSCVDVSELRRARSADAETRYSAEKELFSGEWNYVNTLSEKMPQIWGRVDASSPRSTTVESISTVLGTAYQEQEDSSVEEDQTILTKEKLSDMEGHKPNNNSKLDRDNFGSATTTASTVSGLTLTRVGNDHDSYNGSFSFLPEFNDEDSSEEGEEPAEHAKATGGSVFCSNPGSIGHPELCAHPCAALARGHCEGGDSCQFCHFTHPRRPLHLDKRKRLALKSMSYSECANLLEPLLLRKATELNLNSHALVLIDMLVNVPMRSQDNSSARATRLKQALTKTMNSMAFSSLVNFLIGHPEAPALTQSKDVQDVMAYVRMSC